MHARREPRSTPAEGSRHTRAALGSLGLILSAAMLAGCPVFSSDGVFEGFEGLYPEPRDFAVVDSAPTPSNPFNEAFVVAFEQSLIRIEQDGPNRAAYPTDTSPEDPQRIIPAKINADTTPDVFLKTKSGVSWAEGHKGGPFVLQPVIFPQAVEPFNADNIAAADVDNDKDIDLAVLYTDTQGPPFPTSLHIFLNDGGGVFAPGPVLALPTLSFAEALSAGDVNGDTRPDLLAVSGAGSHVLAGQPNGSFLYFDTATGAVSASPTTPLSGGRAGLLALVSADTAPDIVLCPNNGGVSLRLGNGNGTFQPPTTLPGIFASNIVVDDFNADNLQDVAIAGEGPGVVSIYHGAAGGGLGTPLKLDASQSPDRLGVFYAPGDERPDLFTVHLFNNVIQSYINTDAGWRVADRVPFVDENEQVIQPNDATFADVNGDDYLDVVAIGSVGHLTFTLNAADGSGDLLPTRARDIGPGLGRIQALAPLVGQGDARQPIATCVNNSTTAVIARLNTAVSPPEWLILPTFSLPFAITDIGAGDFNNDGRDDIVYSHGASGGSFTVRFQSAAGVFDTQQNFAFTGGVWSNILVADLDNASGPDVILADSAGGALRTLQSDGVGGFVSGFTTSFSATLSTNVAMGDLNGDGQDEMIVGVGPAGGNNGSVRVLSLTPSGGLASTAIIPTFARAVRVAVGDYDGDGRQDIAFGSQAAASFRDGALGVILNTPTGIASGVPTYYYASGDTKWADVADLRAPLSRARGAAPPALTAIVMGPSQIAPYESMTILHSLFLPLPSCTGDANGDNVVDFLDLNIVLSDFGLSGAPGALQGDLDNDGDCDFIDLNIVLSAFGTAC